MKAMHGIAFFLLVVGGLNWLLVGLFGWDIGQVFGGQAAGISRIIYILVGLSALYLMFTHKQTCKYCMMGGDMKKPSGMPMGGGQAQM